MEDVKYIRVSSPEQNPARQKDDLKPYTDICSGSIPFRDRENGEKLIKHAQLGYINTIQLLTKLQVNVISQKEGLHTLLEDGTENPPAKLMVGILGTLAEFELTRIKERQAEGIAKAKERGVYKTNGGNRATETRAKFLSKKKNALCLKELKRGNSVRRSAKIAGVSLMTAQKVKNYILEG